MKRILSLICAISVLMMALSSCTLFNKPLHQHSFGTEWACDEESHWNPCIAMDGCGEKTNVAQHDFVERVNTEWKTYYICQTCGYHKGAPILPPAHKHIFSDAYSHDYTMHWRACTDPDCNEVTAVSNHKYNTPKSTYSAGTLTTVYTCVDCEFEVIVTQDASAGVISGNHWKFIFERFALTNYTVNMYITDDGYEQHNTCIVTDSGVYQSIADSYEIYVVKNEGVWEGYQKGYYAIEFGDMNPDQVELEGRYNIIYLNSAIYIPFAENFDKFTYDASTGMFTCTETLVATYGEEGEEEELYCSDIQVQIVNEKVIYIAADYTFGDADDTATYRFVYEGIGISNVKVPQYVIDEANKP